MENSEPYTDPRVPPPVKYNLVDYMSLASSSKRVSGVHEKESCYELQPLDLEDMARYAAPDYSQIEEPVQTINDIPNMQTMGQSGKMQRLDNKSFVMGVRPDMSDEEFKSYTGITW